MTELNIALYIPNIQTWMDNNIKVRTSSTAIYPKLIEERIIPDNISQSTFSCELSISVREGKIVGFVGSRGKFGGYSPLNDNGEAPVSRVMAINSNELEDITMAKKQEKEVVELFKLKIDEECCIEQRDSRNYEVTVGKRVLFASSLKDAFKLLASRILEKEVKQLKTNVDFSETVSVIQTAEDKIIAKLNKLIG